MSPRTVFPEYPAFAKLLACHRLVPLSSEIITDLDTPLTLFAKIAHGDQHAFLFESMEGGEKWGRYSFIGWDPLVTCVAKGDQVTITEATSGAPRSRLVVGNPLHLLRSLIKELNAAELDGLPRFCGGAVGFLGYDMVRFMEDLPDTRPVLPLPDSSFMVPRLVLVHDSFKQKVTAVCWVRQGDDEPEQAYRLAEDRLAGIIAKLRGPVPPEFTAESDRCQEAPHVFTANMDAGQFQAMVARAKDYILAGDIIQVVLSQRFHTRTSLTPITLYRALRHINPSPYLFFLQQGDLVQIGSSPEILVRKTGDQIELRPIAGTRRRGSNETEDLALEAELLADPKERAEHLMLVDLGRNDVGRVAADGQVEVQDLLVIERYSHVMHIVSGVHGRIAPDKDQFDVINACFPAGTVSGAPKIRAMQIIDELEPERRGAYAGSVGYFGFSGNMDFCITIRTFVMQGENLWIQAGAGIVADSDPALEYEETINKSLGLRRAVELAEKGF